jgi:hypothetical protein
MLENAVRICDANFGHIYRWDGEVLHLLASHNTPPGFRRSSQAFTASSLPGNACWSHGRAQSSVSLSRNNSNAGLH